MKRMLLVVAALLTVGAVEAKPKPVRVLENKTNAPRAPKPVLGKDGKTYTPKNLPQPVVKKGQKANKAKTAKRAVRR